MGAATFLATAGLVVGFAPIASSQTSTKEVNVLVNVSHGQFGLTYDVPTASGAEYALHQINAAGGFQVGGTTYKFHVIPVEVTDSPTTAVSAETAAAQKYNPVAAFGTIQSNTAVPISTVLQPKKIILFSGGAGFTNLVGKPGDEQVIQTISPNAGITPFMVYFKHHIKGAKRVTIVQPNSTSGESEGAAVASVAREQGLTPTNIYFPADLTDYSSVITDIGRTNPQAIFVGQTPANILPIVQGAISAGYGDIYMGTAIPPDAAISQGLGSKQYLNLIYTADLTQPKLLTPALKTYAKGLAKYTGQPMNAESEYSLTEYPEAYALVKAMQAADSVTNTVKITAKLKGSSGVQVIPYKINKKGVVFTAEQLIIYSGSGHPTKSSIVPLSSASS